MPLPFQLLFVVVFVLLIHHCADFHGQTEQVDEPVCVLVVVKLACCEGSDGFVIQAVRRCRACRDDIALIQLKISSTSYLFLARFDVSAKRIT
mgnify:CR=1 FL=1